MEDKQLPVPYFKVNLHYQILACSSPAADLFAASGSWLSFIDEGSLNKARTYISPDHTDQRVELILKTRSAQVLPFEVYQHWDEEECGHLVCISRDKQYKAVAERLERLHENLENGMYEPAVRQAGSARSYLSASHTLNRELCSVLETVKDLLDQVHPSLVEIHQTDYSDIIRQLIDTALKNASREMY
ncbi:hypothetical protein JJQ72_19690 [Paenibacillus sp. F411]|uniref:Uncharacterized protein n=1 Tax=Paenibacillus algicola TaxID=2565926 RepID=A0A4P8XG11_9BACL|nr:MULTISPECIES: hypothetical protein [Paenibacillus]MBO2946203.1 hypothetical protein [Paenibacillus sp. F411]QCT01225.1 hypothetical protein E6C60_0502 [Paenibacillus algicola]